MIITHHSHHTWHCSLLPPWNLTQHWGTAVLPVSCYRQDIKAQKRSQLLGSPLVKAGPGWYSVHWRTQASFPTALTSRPVRPCVGQEPQDRGVEYVAEDQLCQ